MKKEILSVLLTDTHLKDDNTETVYSIFEQAIKFCLENNIEMIHHLGDNFHSRKSQSEKVLNTFHRILDLCSINNITLLSIVGNHDKTNQSEEDSFLSPFYYHPALRLVKSYTCEEYRIQKVDYAFHFLSYFTKDIYNEILSSIQLDTAVNILFTHCDINGFKMNGSKVSEGHLEQASFQDFSKVLVGHYHDTSEEANISYIGASLQHNFGETSNKGLTILYTDLTTEIIELKFPRFKTNILSVSELSKFIPSTDFQRERVVIRGTEEELKKLDKSSLQQLGVEVKLENVGVLREEIVSSTIKIEGFSDLEELFNSFCEENKIEKESSNLGLGILKEIVK